MKTISTAALYEVYKSNPNISIDSRKITDGCIYFALKGENFNGNKFAKEALDKGAAKVVVDQKEYVVNEHCLLVEDGLTALQALARHHRNQLSIPILGITGSNGKTTTKELVAAVLQQKYNCFATKGNLNNHIGVPLSILSIDHSHECAIIEMGANHQGEIDFLCSIAQPNYAIITNIGKSHLEGFGGVEGVKKGKSELYQFIRKVNGEVFINADDKLLMEMAKELKKYTYGKSKENFCSGFLTQTHPNIKAKWSCGKNNGNIAAQLYGGYNFTNIMAAVCVGSYFKVANNKIDYAINNYRSVNNRSQYIEKKDYKIYLDAYNANPSSMKLAIENFAENQGEEKWLILGDMFEVGERSHEEHQAIIKLVENLEIENSFFVGENFYKWNADYPHFTFFKDTTIAKEWFHKLNKSNKQFLMKGSRGIGLEKLIEA